MPWLRIPVSMDATKIDEPASMAGGLVGGCFPLFLLE